MVQVNDVFQLKTVMDMNNNSEIRALDVPRNRVQKYKNVPSNCLPPGLPKSHILNVSRILGLNTLDIHIPVCDVLRYRCPVDTSNNMKITWMAMFFDLLSFGVPFQDHLFLIPTTRILPSIP